MQSGQRVWQDPFLRERIFRWRRHPELRYSSSAAAHHNQVTFFQYTPHDEIQWSAYTLWACCYKGSLDVLKWLHAHDCLTPAICKSSVPVCHDVAAREGHFQTVQWIHETFGAPGKPCFTKEAMDGAARYGHLNIVRFLHENRTEGCTRMATDYALSNGDRAMIEYLLIDCRAPILEAFAVDLAARRGYLWLLQILHDELGLKCVQKQLKLASHFDHAEAVHYIMDKLVAQGIEEKKHEEVVVEQKKRKLY